MSFEVKVTMEEKVKEVLDLLPKSKHKMAIEKIMAAKSENFLEIEKVFKQICSSKFSESKMSFFLNMWKSTHLKMLPIYGLSCRLNILASSSDDEQQKLHYYQASDFNSQTSHEDLGIGFDAISHGKLYDDFAYS